ncbi:DUF1579 family protein [Lysobacter tyrosinilyticus]
MNERSATAFALALALSLASASPAAANMPTKSKLTPEQRSALFERAGMVGQQHRRIAALAGDWDVTVSLWLEPGQSLPVVEQGTATFAMVLGERHLRQDLRFSAGGKPFEGVGYIGYDNVTGEYFSSWMDTSFTGAMLAHGAYDAASNAYTFQGAQSDPTGEAKATPVREVLHILDVDHFSYEYYEVHSGKERIAVRLEYQRVR